MVQTLSVQRKSFFCVLENGKILRPLSLSTKASNGSITHHLHHIMVALGNVLYVVASEFFSPSSHPDEVLQTTFCLVEQSLNARPLTEVSSDPNEIEALTPNHFLIGQRSVSFPSIATDEHFDHRKRFLRAQGYANAIWLDGYASTFRLSTNAVNGTHLPNKNSKPEILFGSSRIGARVVTTISLASKRLTMAKTLPPVPHSLKPQQEN